LPAQYVVDEEVHKTNQNMEDIGEEYLSRKVDKAVCLRPDPAYECVTIDSPYALLPELGNSNWQALVTNPSQGLFKEV
jgi:hypothetical protein